MKYKVIRKQENSNMCMICGLKNEFGLKAEFYELENNEVLGIFKGKLQHQGYSNRMHGGMVSSILDETIGRAIMIKDKNMWGVTVELNVKFKKPIPLDSELKVVGRITNIKSKIFEGNGEIVLQNGEIAATADGRYMQIPLEKITTTDLNELGWQVYPKNSDLEIIEK